MQKCKNKPNAKRAKMCKKCLEEQKVTKSAKRAEKCKKCESHEIHQNSTKMDNEFKGFGENPDSIGNFNLFLKVFRIL